MSGKLSMFEPKALFGYFEDICAIPHGSGNEKAIADYLVNFAQAHGLRSYRDDLHNVVIYKPATAGYEDRPTVILQGHSDMVCEKVASSSHDFLKDGIDIIVEDGWIRANGTTLGADNGTAVATMLAILSDDTVAHPALECVFTVQEEVGLIGARNLDVNVLSGRVLINLDGGPDFTAVVSCAGGYHVDLRRQYATELPKGQALRIEIGGLPGGHSGVDIQREHANAIKLMGRILYAARQAGKVQLAEITGGGKDNAIPRDCACTVVVPEGDAAAVRAAISASVAEILDEILETQPEASIQVKEAPLPATVTALADSDAMIKLLFLAPHGVLATDVKNDGYVTSSINLGIVTSDGAFRLTFMARSCVDSLVRGTNEQLFLLAELLGFDVTTVDGYPGWKYASVSPLREALKACAAEKYGHELVIERTHGGLECGVLAGRMPGLDAASIGAHAMGAHTPEEKLEAKSFALSYRFLKDVLAIL